MHLRKARLVLKGKNKMKVLIIIPLMLVLPKALGIQPINLQKQPNFLKEYKENSIDYTTCDEVHDPYGDPEYATSISDKRYTHKTLTSTTNQNEDEDRILNILKVVICMYFVFILCLFPLVTISILFQ